MRTSGSAAVTRVRTLLIGILATVLGASLLTWATPATAAAKTTDGVAVALTALAPTFLVENQPVRLSGTVTNASDNAWTDLQVYLVIPRSPFTTRKQVNDLAVGDTAYAGERVVEPIEALARLGTLAVGETKPFTLTVPYGALRISGADGVYPVGAQVLGTDDEGVRSAQAIGRATTFLPKLANSSRTTLPASILWPFLSPAYRLADGRYNGADRLLASVAADGRMRRVLDIARSSDSDASTVVIDPSLLTVLRDIASDRYGPPSKTVSAGDDVTDAQRADAQRFLDDLLAYARDHSTWIIGYGRPDVQALAESGSRSAPLREAVETATTETLASFGLSGRRVSWPIGGMVSAAAVRDLGVESDEPVVVSPATLSAWKRRNGSLVTVPTRSGPTPVLVSDPLVMQGAGNDESALVVRQRLVSESALTVMQRSIDPDATSDATLVIDPTWDPPADWAVADFYAALDVPWLAPSSVEARLASGVPAIGGSLRIPKADQPTLLSYTQISLARELAQEAGALSSLTGEDAEYLHQLVAQSVSSRWATSRGAGAATTQALTASAARKLDKVTVDVPKSVTLSSKSGKFPVTVTNGLTSEVTVGIRLRTDSTLDIPDIEPLTVGPGQRATVTVNVDVGDVRRTNVTASLTSPDGVDFGRPARLSLRSSALGMVIWIGMGVAGLLVVAAIIRRIVRRRQLAGSDD